MKPTQEQLNDPKWWNENAPEGAIAMAFKTETDGAGYTKDYSRFPVDEREVQLCLNHRYIVHKRPTKPAFVPEAGDTVMVSLGEGVIKATGVANFKKAYFVQGDNWTETTTKVYPIKSERELFIEKLANLSEGYGSLYSEDFAGAVYDSGLFKLVETDK